MVVIIIIIIIIIIFSFTTASSKPVNLFLIVDATRFQVVGLGFCGTGLLKVAVLCNKFTPISYSRSDCVLG